MKFNSEYVKKMNNFYFHSLNNKNIHINLNKNGLNNRTIMESILCHFFKKENRKYIINLQKLSKHSYFEANRNMCSY